jgi:hypothetical protein
MLDNSLRVYVKEARRADNWIPPILRPLDEKMQSADEYAMIDVNEFMTDISGMHRHRFIFQLQQGLHVHVFLYTWAWGGMFGIYSHVAWRVPPESMKNERDEGMINSQKNIDLF